MSFLFSCLYFHFCLWPLLITHAFFMQGLDPKVIVFKYKKKKNYRRNIGHRQVSLSFSVTAFIGELAAKRFYFMSAIVWMHASLLVLKSWLCFLFYVCVSVSLCGYFLPPCVCFLIKNNAWRIFFCFFNHLCLFHIFYKNKKIKLGLLVQLVNG